MSKLMTQTGVPSNIKELFSTTTTSRSDRGSSTSSSFITLFTLNNLHVKLETANPPFLDETDQIKVVGIMKNGIFNCFAYKNLTKNILNKAPFTLRFIFFLIFSAVAVFTLIVFFPLGLVFLGIAIYFGYMARNYYWANKLLY